MNELIYWYVEMEFKDEEELRTDVKVYIILHMIVFYRWIIESIIKLTVSRTFFFPPTDTPCLFGVGVWHTVVPRSRRLGDVSPRARICRI